RPRRGTEDTKGNARQEGAIMWKYKRGPADFSSEIQSHLDHEADRLIADGVRPDAARLAARKAFGSVAGAEERYYDSQRVLWLAPLRPEGPAPPRRRGGDTGAG